MWKKVVSAQEVPRGSSVCVTVSGWQIAVFHLEEGSWYAVQNICPHHEEKVLFVGSVEGEARNPTLECPLHGSRFRLRDGKYQGDRSGMDLKTYPVYSDGDWVYVDL